MDFFHRLITERRALRALSTRELFDRLDDLARQLELAYCGENEHIPDLLRQRDVTERILHERAEAAGHFYYVHALIRSGMDDEAALRTVLAPA